MPKPFIVPCLALLTLVVGCMREEVNLCDGPDYAWECTCPDAQQQLREFGYYDKRCDVCKGSDPDPKCDDPPAKTDAGKDAGRDGGKPSLDGGKDAAAPMLDGGKDGMALPTDGGGTDGGDAGEGGVVRLDSGDLCSVACGGSMPHCDQDADACRACVQDAHCTGSGKPRCVDNACVQCRAGEPTDCGDPAKPHCVGNACVQCRAGEPTDCAANELCHQGRCVDCLQNSDCEEPDAARCDTSTNTCTDCAEDTDCERFVGATEACAKSGTRAGECVECTLGREDLCGGNVCVPDTETCSPSLAVGALGVCVACQYDSQCTGGDLPLNMRTHRCVPMQWQGAFRNNYCLKISNGANCTKPYSTVIANLSSTSGAAAANYCGIQQTLTTCEAVTSFAADCSVAACPTGGQCELVGATPDVCTFPCNDPLQCPGIRTCDAPTTPYCH